ncbi:MAG: radical SAM protein, partial [Acidobacteria bacterium]|nr:radical SAM protein [Acidobacteriota bacterium]
LVRAEGEPDLLQISGGEPTLHPQILDILKAAKARPIRHVMLNTNGVRIARDPAFVDALAALGRGFEVYLQFDSRRPEALRALRGADLTRVRSEALDALEARGISTTLVCVVARGVNDDEVADVVRHALTYRCVRGVTFQPVQSAGRTEGLGGADRRILLTDLRRALTVEGALFTPADVVPLPCNPENIAIAYAIRSGSSLTPVTSLLPRDLFVRESANAIAFEKLPELKKRVLEALSLGSAGASAAEALGGLLCCLPEFEVPRELTYENVFRVAIVQFLDRFNFDLGQVKRSCVHFVVPGGRMIPFDTYNLFYRDGLGARLRREGVAV